MSSTKTLCVSFDMKDIQKAVNKAVADIFDELADDGEALTPDRLRELALDLKGEG